VLAEEYTAVNELRLSIDGLQPEKGHETWIYRRICG